MADTRTVKTSEIQAGDIVRNYGMRLRVESVRRIEDANSHGGCFHAAISSCLNPDAVREAGVVPISWLKDCRTSDHRDDHPEFCWHIQGNDLATWQVEVPELA
jgi:hypothetical protein